MNLVNIEDLKTGMILARPVKNHQGVLLLEAGTRITKKNIRIFKSWGVNEVRVKGNLRDLEGKGDLAGPHLKDSIEVELKEKFSDVLDEPVMVEIFNAARNRLIKNLS